MTHSLRNSATLPGGRSSGRDFAPAWPNCSPLAFATSLFLPRLALRLRRSGPKDSFLLALAEASQSEFLVTGDKELLSLKQHRSSRIVTPAAMLEILLEVERGERGKNQ